MSSAAPARAAGAAPADATIGIDVGGTKLEGVVLGREGGERWRERVPTPAGDYAGTIAAIRGLVERAEAASGLRGAPVGLGTPGSETPAGLMRNANSTCLNGRPFGRDLAAALGRPVRLANDANCLALSEAVDGAAAGAAVVFAVILGTGVGGGLVVEGRLVAGANGLAGEWGHNPLPWAAPDEQPGPPCYCGRRGCIETWLSGPGLAAEHARVAAGPGAASGAVLDTALDAAAIARAAAAGDAACQATLARHAERLARALAGVVNLLDPDVIVLGGGLSQLDALYEAVPRLWGRHVFSAGAEAPLRTRLVRSRHGDSSGVRGAARLWG